MFLLLLQTPDYCQPGFGVRSYDLDPDDEFKSSDRRRGVLFFLTKKRRMNAGVRGRERKRREEEKEEEERKHLCLRRWNDDLSIRCCGLNFLHFLLQVNIFIRTRSPSSSSPPSLLFVQTGADPQVKGQEDLSTQVPVRRTSRTRTKASW